MSLFTNKTLMITGGTGSFGNAVLNRFLETDIGEIRIFSRDEKKQDDMRHEYQAKMPEVADKIKFYIGDVRNLQSCKDAMHGVDYIFHAAALKQVPSCEFFPMEAVKTNIIGTDNVLTAAIEEGVEAVICLSTDKAAYPINAMGKSKSLEESVAIAKSRYSGKTKICCTRYGNVMCSRGSVIPLWIDQIKGGNPITVTEPNMTRFIMSLEEAVDLVLYAFENGENGDLLIMKAPACSIGLQAEAVTEMFGGKKEETTKPMVYYTDSRLFVVQSLGSDEAKTFEVTNDYGGDYKLSEDSKYIVYTTDREEHTDEDNATSYTYNIYYKEIGNEKDEGTLVAKNVSTIEAVIGSIDKIIYAKDGNVCATDANGETEKLISDANVSSFSSDNSYFVATKCKHR